MILFCRSLLFALWCSVEALSEVLSDWGDDRGSIVVISHDKSFCEQVGFTHVLTITDEGGLHLEQRDANDGDWDSSVATFQKSGDDNSNGEESSSSPVVVDKEVEAKRRKMAFNAPKRIAKIESLVEQKEAQSIFSAVECRKPGEPNKSVWKQIQ